MDDLAQQASYRLVFRAEVLEGQHEAVVKKRLQAALKIGDEQLNQLFSGNPVILRKTADTATAARFQAVFKKAGARLRVLPNSDVAVAVADAVVAGGKATSVAQHDAARLRVLPLGTPVLDPSERHPFEPRDVPTEHIGLAGAQFEVPGADTEANEPAPIIAEFTLAELGANLGPETADQTMILEIDVHYALAEVGADLLEGAHIATPPFDLSKVNFEIAELGVNLSEGRSQVGEDLPPPPDTSHLSLEPTAQEAADTDP